MKKILIPTCLAISTFAASCNNREQTTDTTTSTEVDGTQRDSMNQQDTMNSNTMNSNTNMGNDANFAMSAAEGGMMEVKLGQLAQKNGTSAKIKELGKMMETDHSKANEELKAWAAKNNVSLPASLSQEKQNKYNELAAKKGADFDEAYADAMVEDHEKDIAAFQAQSSQGQNAELKTWAGGKLPVLQHHLEMSRTAAAAVKK